MFQGLQRGADNLIDSVIALIYFMRGAVSFDDAMALPPGIRQRMTFFLENRIKEEKGKMHPVY